MVACELSAYVLLDVVVSVKQNLLPHFLYRFDTFFFLFLLLFLYTGYCSSLKSQKQTLLQLKRRPPAAITTKASAAMNKRFVVELAAITVRVPPHMTTRTIIFWLDFLHTAIKLNFQFGLWIGFTIFDFSNRYKEQTITMRL